MADILVISPTASHPQDAGNRARICNLLRALKKEGHRIHYVFIRFEGGNETDMAGEWDSFWPVPYNGASIRWKKKWFDLLSGILKTGQVLPYTIDEWFTPLVSRHLIKIKEALSPDIVLVEYVFLSKAFEYFSASTYKVLDTHDIFGDRHKMYSQRGLRYGWFYTSRREEKKALDRADTVIAIQDKEAEYFRALTSREVITVGHIAAAIDTDVNANDAASADRLLFVGSGNNINVQAVGWFLDNVWGILHARFPDLTFDVVGGCADHVKTAANVHLIGPVDDLAAFYRRAAVVVNPVQFGTGLKIKSIEALAAGRPLVTTSAGAAGLEKWSNEAYLVADDPAQFVDAVTGLLETAELRNRFSARARTFTEEYNRDLLTPFLKAIGQRS